MNCRIAINHPRKYLSRAAKKRVLERWDNCCGQCQTEGGPFEFDHVTALCNGGTNDESNFWPLCVSCHKPKTKTDIQASAKVKRIQKQDGLMKRKPSRRMRIIAKLRAGVGA